MFLIYLSELEVHMSIIVGKEKPQPGPAAGPVSTEGSQTAVNSNLVRNIHR